MISASGNGLRLVDGRAPGTVLSIVGPGRRARSREHLTPDEMEMLLKAARQGRYGARDYALVLLGWSHGLRISEALWVRWPDLDLKAGIFHVRRRKGSISGDHPLRGKEMRALRQVAREGPVSGDLVFVSERGGQISKRGAHQLIERLAIRAGLGHLAVHPHMLRHSCGYYLAERGVDLRVIQQYLGHSNIQNTIKYTVLSPRKFRGMWDD